MFKRLYHVRNWCKYNNALVNRESIRFVVFGSTGLKVFGKGEWKMRQHGYS
jgi:hypothetical protein